MATLSEKLRSARQQRGWTQTELARLVNIDNSLICRYERGLRPPASTLVKLARALRLEISVEAK